MPDMESPPIRSLLELGRLSVTEHTLPEMLRRIVSIANDAIDRSAMVGLTLDVAGRASSAAFTDEDVPEIDEVQNATGAGPCVEAARHGHVVTIPSTATDDRWMEFCESCVRRGVLSTLSVPIITKSTKRAALNFYARIPEAFVDGDIEIAAAFAERAAVAIEDAEAYWSTRQLAEQLREALDSRVVIEQAKGLLMAGGRTGDAAFQELRRRSQDTNRKLRDVASDIVADAESRADPSREG